MKNVVYLKALDLDKEGKWNEAHSLIQDFPDANAAWIHAYLHRKEGDQWNAEYWYNRADQPVFKGSLEEEWQHIYYTLSDS